MSELKQHGNTPAFPQHTGGKILPSGMTLRQYYASAAMQGLLARDGYDYESCPKELAQLSFQCADALLQKEELNNG